MACPNTPEKKAAEHMQTTIISRNIPKLSTVVHIAGGNVRIHNA